MASDNEDDDLDALREAALATLKQKVQPIENVFSGSNFARSQDTAAWSDVPASIDFPAFSDPVPEQNHFPSPFGETAHQPPLPQHFFRPASNFHWVPSHQNRMPPFHRMRHPRFPHRTFGGPMHDRVNRRIRPRGFMPPQSGRGGPSAGSHPHHLTNVTLPSQAPGMGANLIVIQPHVHPGGDIVPSSTSTTAIPTSASNKSLAVDNLSNQPKSGSTHSSSKLMLPQDKYHSSGNSTFTQEPDKEAEPKLKSKDKFSRYDKSDSEEDDDDLSEVDDIANEIDKVLQEDFLAEEITVQEAEGTELAEEKSETVAEEEEEKKESVEKSPSSSPVSHGHQEIDNNDSDPKTPVDAVSDISDSESLDLDALAGGEPVLGDLEDLDSLVDKEPDIVMDVVGSKDVIDSNCRKGSVDSNDNDRNIESRDNCDDSSKKDSEIRGSSREKRKSPLHRRSPLSPNNHRNSLSPTRYKNPISPRNYDSYSHRAYPSPRRSRSPLYNNRHPTYRSTSPRSTFRPRSRSPYRNKSPMRRSSISPRRRMGSPSSRRYESSPRRYPVDTARRRSLSPIRRARSPLSRDRYRPSREESNRVRDGSRQGERRYRDLDRSRRDRPRQVEQDRSENQRESNSTVKDTDKKTSLKDTDKKIAPVNQRISPLMEKNNISQEKEKVSVDLEKLTPEERAKIEARRKKFDSSAEVNITEASKKISLKDIKKREKKAKKKEDEEKAEKAEVVENLKIEEPLPDVVNKKSSSKAGISLKKLRKKQESKKKKDEEEDQESLNTAGLVALEDESEDDSDGDRSWRKESSGVSGPGIRFGVSRTMVNKAPLVSLDSIGRGGGREGGRRYQDLSRRQPSRHHERRNRTDRSAGSRSQRIHSNRWSSDEDSDNGGIQASRLNSSVVTSKPFEADVPPEKLRIQVQIASKESKKKSKAVPDFSNVYSVHAKRHRSADVSNSYSEEKEGVEEDIVPAKKMKKKKEKKKKHSKDGSPKRSSVELRDEIEMLDSPSKSPAKPSVLERLGKKVSLDSLEKKEKKKKKSKKNRDIDEDTDDLDLHILKMKAKNEEILRRQREIQLDKERYG